VVDRSDSQVYAVRRFDNVRTSPTVLKNALGKWYDVRHPSIVSLYSVSAERGALFFTHAYHPAAQTLKQRFIDQRGPLLNEALLWRVLTQLLSGLRLVHGKNMALRVISPVHVLLTSGTVVRFNCVGIPDVLEFESRKTLTEMQIDDLVKLGYLILSLAARAFVGPKNVDQALLLLQQHFSPDLVHVVTTLLGGKSAASQICHMISERVHDEFDSAMAASDALHRYTSCEVVSSPPRTSPFTSLSLCFPAPASHLRNEYENGRLLRLLMKLGFMNERPEYARAPQWSETGDRYVLKLFRDYVFHQCLSDGAPVLDAGHVVSALNKLDQGDQEQMLLSSRDNKDLLVVSFSDVRRCLESTFIDLESQAEAAQQMAAAAGARGGDGGGGGGGGGGGY
jgi:PAB-dependent poly(A)-specific ribonuclease subunit 3